MTLQSGSLGKFWFGPQTAKGTAATTYYGYKGNLVDLAPQQIVRNIGPQVGGSFVPPGSVKTGAFGGGAAIFAPSLDDYIGWLLYAFAGSVTSNSMGGGTYYEHLFPSGADSTAPGKYLTGRRSVPGTATLYEQMEDLVPVRILLGVTPGEYATMRFEAVGRTISSPDGSGWAYTTKDETTVPLGVRGGIEIPDGSEHGTITGLSLEIANVIPDIRQVMVIGSYYPYDFPVLARNITANFNYLWESKTFYDNFYWNGTAWQPTIYSSSLDVYIQTPGDIAGAAVPYELKLWAANVDWQCAPPRLAGGELVAFAVTGTVTAAASGFDWFLKLRNGTSLYTWPT